MEIKNNAIKFILLLLACLPFSQCKKDHAEPQKQETPVPGDGLINAGWSFDKVHSNILWSAKFYDYSEATLVGRFNNFNFSPKLIFDEKNLSNCSINTWITLSSFDSGEPGRDGNGKCARSYLGVTYLDTLKTLVDPLSDSALFQSTSVERSGKGYLVKGNFSFNRYRAPSGFTEGTKITKQINMDVTYAGMKDFDSNGDGINDKYRAALTGNFSFLRSDFMDTSSTIQWVPVPSQADATGNQIAGNNKTFGVWTSVLGNKINVTFNMQFYKDH